MEEYANMKKIIPHVKKFFGITFALYTCVSFGMMLLNIAFVSAAAPEWSGVALLFSQILLFASLCGLFVTVFDAIKKLNRVLGHLLKFVFCYGAFYLCFFALVKGASEPINIVVLSTAFVLIYAVVAAISAGIRALSVKGEKSDEYVNVYSDVK